jgi:hypothetical protein
MSFFFFTKHKTIEYGVAGICICRNPIASYKVWTVGVWIAASKRLIAFSVDRLLISILMNSFV